MPIPLILAILLGNAPPKPAVDEMAELAMLQGIWETVGAESNGKTLDHQGRKREGTDLVEKLIIKDETFLVVFEGKEASPDDALPFKINFATSPRIVRWDLDKGEKHKNYAIYTIDKDTLKLAINLQYVDSKERMPKEFKTKKDDGVYIYIFKRVKGK